MNRQLLLRRLNVCTYRLNNKYIPIDKPLAKIAELTAILPALGLFFLWHYFESFGISYFLYFNITDAIAVLYENLMLVVFIGVVLSPGLIALLLPDFLKKHKGLTKLSIVIIGIMIITGIGVFIDLYKFATIIKLIFLAIAAISGYIYFFESRNLGFWMLLALTFIYMYAIATQEAKYMMREKPKFNIVLKQHSEKPILKSNDTDKYFIFKTSNYYFIKDDNLNLIYAYSISTDEMTSFTPEK
ncbi:hypothetical protein ACP3T3_01000 [Chryseobacterium sp. CBSDS_008]|uniref:hypothetical protein n=1 Tax=Chryseobacterium sp. CBSDS_008 TaxID=3415265 RepID=UPI003CF7D67C